MKKLLFLITCLAVAVMVQAQVNVRVKNSGNSKELDINMGGGSSKSKGAENRPAAPDSKPPQTGGTSPGSASVPKTDTTNKPVVINEDVSYNGPAKSMVASFYKQAESVKEAIENGKKYGSYNSAESKVMMMETNIKKIREKDPGYSNIAQLEAICSNLKKEVETAKSEAGSKIADKRKEQADNTTNERLLEIVIDGTNMEVGANNLPYMDQAMKDFKTKADEVMKLDLTKHKVKLDDLKLYVDKSHTLAADRIMAKAGTVIKELKEAENFAPILKELQFRQMYWDVVRKIYPGDAVCEKYYKRISEVLTSIGSPEDIKKTAGKNEAAAIKDRKLAVPVVKDAAMEKILITGFNSKYGGVYKGTALKAILLQDGWTIERNDVSGIVTGRNRITQLAYKGSDGKCYLLPQNIYIYQAYVGSSFTNTEVIYNGFSGQEMLCENVK